MEKTLDKFKRKFGKSITQESIKWLREKHRDVFDHYLRLYNNRFQKRSSRLNPKFLFDELYPNDIGKCYCGKATPWIIPTGYQRTCSAKCAANSDTTREKYKVTCRKKYGAENVFASSAIKSRIRDTNMARYGVDNPAKSETVKAKIKSVCQQKFKSNSPLGNAQVRQKRSRTMMERYGVDTFLSKGKYRKKRDKGMKLKYGVKHPIQNPELSQRIIQTNLDRYGVGNVFSSKEVQAAIRDTIRSRYGVEHVTQNKWIRRRIEATCLERYGVKHPTQNPDIMRRALRSMFKSYTHVDSSGKSHVVMGYEGNVIDFINEKGGSVFTKHNLLKPIPYGERVYHPDLVSERDGVFDLWEVKSVWTLIRDWKTNLKKFKSANERMETESGSFVLAVVHNGRVHTVRAPTKKSVKALIGRLQRNT